MKPQTRLINSLRIIPVFLLSEFTTPLGKSISVFLRGSDNQINEWSLQPSLGRHFVLWNILTFTAKPRQTGQLVFPGGPLCVKFWPGCRVTAAEWAATGWTQQSTYGEGQLSTSWVPGEKEVCWSLMDRRPVRGSMLIETAHPGQAP